MDQERSRAGKTGVSPMKTWSDYGIDVGSHTTGEHKTTCPWCSHSRKKKNFPCLNVNLDKGVYHCWHCGAAGSLKTGEWQRPEIVKVYSKPAYQPRPADDIADWFAERGISKAVIDRNRIGRGVAYTSPDVGCLGGQLTVSSAKSFATFKNLTVA